MKNFKPHLLSKSNDYIIKYSSKLGYIFLHKRNSITFSGSLKSKSSQSDLMKGANQNLFEPAFDDIKRKLKLVLSGATVPVSDFRSNCVSIIERGFNYKCFLSNDI